MFNAMTPAELTALLARQLGESADWTRPLDGFQVGQLKSAGSIGRHLTAELRGAPAAAAAFAHDLARVLAEEPVSRSGPAPLTAACAALARALADDPPPAELGAALADLLAACRGHPEAAPIRARVRRSVRELADAEIAILSRPPPTGMSQAGTPRPTTGGAA